MAKKGQSKLLFWIKALFIGASLFLFFSHPSWAENCTKTEIESNIEQFKNKDTKKVDAAIDAVVQCREDAIASLEQALSENEAAIRANAASALGKMGVTAQNISPILVKTLEDSEEKVRTEALSALIQIGQGVKNQQKSLEEALVLLEKDEKKWAGKEKEIAELRRLTRVGFLSQLNYLNGQRLDRVAQWIRTNPWVCLPPVYFLVNLGIFIVRPTFLLTLDKWLSQVKLINKVTFGFFVFFKYNPRVLDAWVNQRIKKARENFKGRQTVLDRKIHVAQPVILEEKKVESKYFNAKEFAPIFNQPQVRLVIWGEGGSGKTSLACQIAEWAMWGRDKEEKEKNKRLRKHRMLPILIEEDVADAQALNKSICRQLKDLTPQEKDISEELVKELLAKQRILVIVDRLSELSQATRNSIQSGINQLPLNFLVITSRVKGILGKDIPATAVMQPCRIKVDSLAGFLNEYLSKKGMVNEFDEFDYSRAYGFLGDIVSVRQAGEKKGNNEGVTILLVELYAKQMIAAKTSGSIEELPDNVPDLMLQYLNELNLNIKEDKLRDTKIHEISQIVAWECIKSTFKPESVKVKQVVATLAELESGDEAKTKAEEQLDYLEKKLSLVHKHNSNTMLRFNLDPLAEYLASLHLIDEFKADESKWKELVLQEAEQKPGFPEEIKGFLLALRDCCEEKGQKSNVLEWVAEELAKKAKLDLEAIQAAQRKRRVKKLIEDLSAPETEYCLRAVRDLAHMGEDAKTAIPYLGKLLENESKVVEIRLETFKVIKHLRADYNRIPIVTINANGNRAISLSEPPHTKKSINLVNGITLDLDMVKIPGGKFLMGTEDEEIERLVKKFNWEDFRREKPQHEVTVQPFLMGKYPVTQAQWREIASLSKVERDLNTDPSYFKGDNLPVEAVSWYDAVEFCQRLSRQTGKEYRLPSEAEWEYACRAGTTTPFHFGETITTDLANYNGKYTYANEPKGEYREQTTPVGSFPPNAFGLYDMHGNVWEWCEDDWHDNYEGAPTDGSAWRSKDSIINVMRGGSWLGNLDYCRSATRYYGTRVYRNDDVGFRVVCVAGRTTR